MTFTVNEIFIILLITVQRNATKSGLFIILQVHSTSSSLHRAFRKVI